MSADVSAPKAPGTSEQIKGGRPLAKYITFFAIASVALFATYSAAIQILIPNQVQGIESLRADPNWTYGAQLSSAVAGTVAARTAADIGLVTGIGALFTIISQPLCGALSDRLRSRWGRRSPFILLGACVGALFLIALAQANTVVLVMCFWILAQISLNFMQAPLTTTIADRIPENQRGSVSGISGVGTMLGGVLGGILAGLGMNAIGFPVYYVFGIACVIGAVLFIVGCKDTSSAQLEVAPFSWKAFFTGFAAPLKDHDFRWMWLARFALILGYFGLTTFNQQILQYYVQPHLSQTQANEWAPILQFVSMPFMLVAMIVFGRMSDKMGKRKPFVFFTSIGMAITLLIPLIWPTLPAMMVYNVLLGVVFGAYMSIDQAMFIDVLPNPDQVGKDLGMANVATNLGQSAGPLIGGVLVAAFSGYSIMYFWAIIWAIVGALAIIPVKKVH